MNLSQLSDVQETVSAESLEPIVETSGFYEVRLDMQSLNALDAEGLVDQQEVQSTLQEAPSGDVQKINIKLDGYVQQPGVIESEYHWTALVKDAAFLEGTLEYCDIEQWQMWIDKTTENRLSGKQRVRKTTASDGKSSYEFTIKVRQAEIKDQNYVVNKEYNTSITEEMFKVLKFMYPDGQLKRRFTIPIEGSDLKFEVDAYYKEDGKLSDYVSVELETKTRLESVPSLPQGLMLIEDTALIQKLKKSIFKIDHTTAAQ